MHVLVVEDDDAIRETIGIVLEAYRHHADLVSDARESIEILEKRIGHWPDVMLLDLKLAAETGEEVFGKIRARFGRVLPTVVISAAQDGAARAKRIPGATFLSKPYTIDQLLQSIEDAASSGRLKSNSA
jgi:DNA-binding NtrC family response regulator